MLLSTIGSWLSLAALIAASPLPEQNAGNERRATYGQKYMFVFGDSYSKTSYSWQSSYQPRPENTLGNPTIGTGTSSGGYNWVDYLVTTYNNSLLYTYDMAIGGSVVNKSIVDPHYSRASDFGGEMSGWDKYAATRSIATDWTSDNALFAVWFGVNDVNQGFNNSDLDTQYERAMNELFNVHLVHLIANNATNFAILNLPPISRTPEGKGYSKSDRTLLFQAQHLWIDKMNSYFDNFTASYSNVTAVLVDAAAAFATVLDHPKNYGFPNATCQNTDGVSCPWWDHLHPGVKIQSLVARKVAKAFPSFFTVT